jgi:hypothetical protein
VPSPWSKAPTLPFIDNPAPTAKVLYFPSTQQCISHYRLLAAKKVMLAAAKPPA